MSNHNYNNYYKKSEEKKQVVVEPEQETHEVTPEVTAEVEPEVTTVVIPESAAPVESETVNGVVSNCVKLNVREKAESGSRVVSIIDAGTELTVSIDESIGNFYKICTASGVEGYCVKDYVRLV